jgi:uncharacterized protein YndB with AHSA1/START domain
MSDDTFTSTLTIEVSAPINRVWSLMTDIHGWPDWRDRKDLRRGHARAVRHHVERHLRGETQSLGILF